MSPLVVLDKGGHGCGAATVSQQHLRSTYRQFKPLPTARKPSASRTTQRRMWAAPLPLPIRQRSRHISIAEPEPHMPPNAGENHIVGEPMLGK
jgi:hypothetical protein